MVSPSPRIYYYILKIDLGAAPCIENGFLTLAICKPAIRRTAKKGDWLIGFTPKNEGHKLAYIAEITDEPIEGQDYYNNPKYNKRLDNIYIFENHEYSLKNEKIHKEKNVITDVGDKPKYSNAFVLKSEKFSDFRDNPKSLPSDKFPYLLEKLGRLTQGHRVNHSDKVRVELEKLIKKIRISKKGVLGKPQDPIYLNHEEDATSKYVGKC